LPLEAGSNTFAITPKRIPMETSSEGKTLLSMIEPDRIKCKYTGEATKTWFDKTVVFYENNNNDPKYGGNGRIYPQRNKT
jgi:hypothetical protein